MADETSKNNESTVPMGYAKKGATGGYSSTDLTWITNTQLALFNDCDVFSQDLRNPDFTLSDYTWYPEMYLDYEYNDISKTIQSNVWYSSRGEHRANAQHPPLKQLFSRTPYIKIRSFKPNLTDLGSMISLFKTMFTVGSQIFSNEYGDVVKKAVGIGFTKDGLSSTIKKTFESVSFMKNGEDFNMFYNGVNAFYRRLLTGVYMTSYEMPFYNSNVYIKSNAGTWGYTTLMGGFSSMLEDLIGSVDILNSATWSAQGNTGINGTTGYDAITFDFSLFNRTADDVYKNIKFIHTLIPEALWIQNGLFQIPGTVYDVEIPGRTRLYWCTGEFKCEYQGKTRYFTNYNVKNLLKHSQLQNFAPIVVKNENGIPVGVTDPNNNKYGNATKYIGGRNIRDLNLIPDAYKLTCTLNSLLPNNLNTYLYGLFESDTLPEYGYQVKRLTNDMITKFSVTLLSDGLNKLKNDDKKTYNTSEADKKKIDEVLEQLNKI